MKFLPHLTRGLMALLAAAALSAQAQTAPKVEAAWARPTVEGQTAGGGFLKITGGASADRLLSASATVSKSTELHTMVVVDNVMRMRPIDALDIPAGGTVELKPGGNHVMFMGLAQPLKAGAKFPLTLRFEKAGEVKVEVQVAAQPPAAGGHQH